MIALALLVVGVVSLTAMLFSLEAQRLFLRLPSRWRNITFHSERAKKMWPRHSIALAEPRSKISWSYLSLFHSALCHCDCDCIKHVFVMLKARAPRERRKIVWMQFGTTKSTQGTNGRIWQSKIFEWTSDILWRHLCICLIDCILFLLVCVRVHMHVQDLARVKTNVHDWCECAVGN